MYDIFFITYNEPNADENWNRLASDQPHARRIDSINGILAAHQQCARISRTSNLFVVDADNEVLDTMNFGLKLSEYDKNVVHIWRALNPLNGLKYGWGGIKLFPKKMLLEKETMPLDMSTSFPLKIVDVVGSITKFNNNAFDTWRSAFRECVKLTNNSDSESMQRLNTWCSVANGTFDYWCLKGACDGRDFAISHKDEPDMLLKINDWDWLKNRYSK